MNELLDNPIWNALRTEHASVALGDERARRYLPDIGPLSGIPDQAPGNYEALRSLAGVGAVALFSIEAMQIPSGWKTIRGGPLVQMIRSPGSPSIDGSYHLPPAPGLSPSEKIKLRRLTAADAPAMVALAELTEPGPFHLRTIELGNFYGVLHENTLLAMAGKRIYLPGMVEVSGVCTHPEARGRGYAAKLMSVVISEIEAEGKVAFLHSLAENPAIRVYERLGFKLRQNLTYAVLAPDS